MTVGALRPVTRRVLMTVALAGLAAPRLALAQVGREEPMTRVRFAFHGMEFTATLNDAPSARDLASLLPLDLTIGDYANNEKIAYLPRKLTEQGAAPFANEAPGDLCYYAPWGNLALFYGGYRWSRGLIRLGRLDGGVTPLLTRGEFPLGVERLT